MRIREATESDFEHIWPIFQEVVSAGDTYGFSADTNAVEARRLWLELPRKTFVAEDNGEVVATYYIKTNHYGPGQHVCNCGYMVASLHRGKGIAAQLCEHSQLMARSLDYKAMQFNFVATSNTSAVRLWSKLGFETVGRLPGAFNHPEQGFVDALVMYKWL